jgi:serine phosphatase RsbU (regulator of sigma subunit)
MQAKYEGDKKQKEIELLTKDQEKQAIFNKAIIAVAILIFIVAFFVYRSYLIKKRANVLLEQQNNEIREQKEQIEEQKQEITDSIRYARRIQQAVLPPQELFDEFFKEYFILFRPRDIVSGDFYWATEKDGKVYVAAADCTGHGVPGAFMSMLGISFLNEILNKGEVNDAADILNELRENVISSLRQTGKANEAKDGMDISLSIIDKENKKVDYAGAYNPLYILRNGEIIQHKADKMPIGIHFKESKGFTNNALDVMEDDVLYMFSDGYVDQFGGESGRKFMANRFKDLIVSIADQSLEKQRDILDVKIDMWRGERHQVDDILVLGIKI